MEAFGVVVMQSMGVKGSGIILHANNVIQVMLSLSECYVPGYTLLLCRISAAELLQLDFFNEWSVHLDCSWTSQKDVLQFRIRDDVIRTKNHQKEGEAIQFDFNLNNDEPREMAAELVRVATAKYHSPYVTLILAINYGNCCSRPTLGIRSLENHNNKRVHHFGAQAALHWCYCRDNMLVLTW